MAVQAAPTAPAPLPSDPAIFICQTSPPGGGSHCQIDAHRPHGRRDMQIHNPVPFAPADNPPARRQIPHQPHRQQQRGSRPSAEIQRPLGRTTVRVSPVDVMFSITFAHTTVFMAAAVSPQQCTPSTVMRRRWRTDTTWRWRLKTPPESPDNHPPAAQGASLNGAGGKNKQRNRQRQHQQTRPGTRRAAARPSGQPHRTEKTQRRRPQQQGQRQYAGIVGRHPQQQRQQRDTTSSGRPVMTQWANTLTSTTTTSGVGSSSSCSSEPSCQSSPNQAVHHQQRRQRGYPDDAGRDLRQQLRVGADAKRKQGDHHQEKPQRIENLCPVAPCERVSRANSVPVMRFPPRRRALTYAARR